MIITTHFTCGYKIAYGCSEICVGRSPDPLFRVPVMQYIRYFGNRGVPCETRGGVGLMVNFGRSGTLESLQLVA